jgi:hypothetical protein
MNNLDGDSNQEVKTALGEINTSAVSVVIKNM